MRLFKGLIAAAITAALLVVPAGALAKGRDRDHDRMPDKWEKKHHLNPRANDARKDADRDGLSNLSEFRHHTDPQKADTDDDGVGDENEVEDGSNPDDADEISGTVASFDNGVLTIQLPGEGAGTVSGTVNDATRIECDDASAPTATTSRDGSDDNSGPGSGGDDATGDDNSGTGSTSSGSDDGDNHDAGDDDQGENENENETCTSADLKQGVRIHEAKFVKASDGTTVFTKLELG